MHKRLHALVVSTIITGSLLCPYIASAQSVNTPPQNNKQIIQIDKQDKLGFLKGHLSDTKSKDMKGVIEFFKENTDLFHMQDPASQLKLISIKKDNVGYTHIKVQQVYNGTDIYGKQYIIHFNKDGCIYSVNGKLDPDINKKYTPSKSQSFKIDETKAIEIAKKTVNVTKTSSDPKVKSYIYNLNGEYMPVYEIDLFSVDPQVSNWIVYVNRETGDVVKKINNTDELATKAEATGVLGDKKTINVDSSGGKYSLIDSTAGLKITTYDGSNIKSNDDSVIERGLPGRLYTKTTNTFNDQKDRAAVDAHAYAKVVYDYYKNKFGRNSIDDKGMNITSTVHVGNKWCNAMWNGSQMVYGDGDGKTAIALSGGLDVVGHELTHGVDQYECALDYSDQSGALNESMSDVFGTLIKFDYKKGNATFVIGEDVWTPGTGHGLRDMENPSGPKAYSPQPDNMSNYIPDGDVHENSGIPNKAACLVMKSIGFDKAGRIYYDALRNDLISSSNFHDARLALTAAADRDFGENSAESKAVSTAFDTVGIE